MNSNNNNNQQFLFNVWGIGIGNIRLQCVSDSITQDPVKYSSFFAMLVTLK